MKNTVLVCVIALPWILVACGDPCDGSITCDEDCDGVVDQSCSINEFISAETGGTLKIEAGPLTGFSLEIPPNSLQEDTEISLEVVTGQVVQSFPLDQSADAPLIIDLMEVVLSLVPEGEQVQAPIAASLLEWMVHNGITSSELVFALEPSGLVFAAPARLTLPYSSLADEGQELWQLLRVGQWSSLEPSGRILANTSVDPAVKTVSVDVHHFSEHQLIDGIGQTIRSAGLAIAAETTALLFVKTALIEGTQLGIGTNYSKSEILNLAEELAPELFCPFQDTTLDMSVPPKVKWNELMGELSTMVSLFNPNGIYTHPLSTGKEAALAAKIREELGPVSLARSFELSMKLHGNQVWDALLAVHNLGQPYANLAPLYESMAYIDPIITDNRGGQYHTAGLTLLNMFNAQYLPEGSVTSQAVLSAYGDEVILSGILGGAFEPGELLANLIGSQLFRFFGTWQDDCDPLQVEAHFCTEGNPYVSAELLETDTAVIHGTCNGAERTWHLEMDESGIGLMPMVPDSCTALHLEVTLRDGQEFVGDTVQASPASTSTDLGVLTIPGVLLSSIEGVVVDDQLQAAVNADVTFAGVTTQTDSNGVFTLVFAEDQFVDCQPLIIDASLGELAGTSAATAPILGTTNVGIIELKSTEPLPIVSFNRSTSRREYSGGSGISDVEGEYAESGTSAVLISGTVVKSESITTSSQRVSPAGATEADVDLVTFGSYSSDSTSAYTGPASPSFSETTDRSSMLNMTLEVRINNTVFGSVSFENTSMSHKSATQATGERLSFWESSSSSVVHKITRVRGQGNGPGQDIQIDVEKTTTTLSQTVDADLDASGNETATGPRDRTVSTFTVILRGDGQGGVTQIVGTPFDTTTSQTVTDVAYFSQVCSSCTVDGLVGRYPDTVAGTISLTFVTNPIFSFFAP